MRIDGRIMQAAESKKGVIYIYDEIKNDSYDWWNGAVIVSETSEKFIRDRLAEFEGVSQLDIHISSCGGSVKVAMGLYSQIKAFACPKKTAYGGADDDTRRLDKRHIGQCRGAEKDCG